MTSAEKKKKEAEDAYAEAMKDKVAEEKHRAAKAFFNQGLYKKAREEALVAHEDLRAAVDAVVDPRREVAAAEVLRQRRRRAGIAQVEAQAGRRRATQLFDASRARARRRCGPRPASGCRGWRRLRRAGTSAGRRRRCRTPMTGRRWRGRRAGYRSGSRRLCASGARRAYRKRARPDGG